ncbi:Putative signal-transduction protein with CBS domains [Rubrivivax sp. A210]|uniref:CBS domain-containing protein n=1 Tax=Rubrivivax sp. A210 TaxID=2772301 RepID=UPI0019189023|nr:CBS domain-containing protein [Rubrivivax sp. A210]CAD5375077.1 Putative signal-transduction protein with CBS domains [Rubrivivax sp. A210]
MFNERVRHVMTRERLVVAPPQTSVRAAARLMAETASSALLVVDSEKLVGIFTARDALRRVIACDRDADATALDEVMTKSPLTVAPERLFGFALQVMQERGVRHLPVVEGQRAVGIVTARSVLDPEMEDFNCEALRREGFSTEGVPRG